MFGEDRPFPPDAERVMSVGEIEPPARVTTDSGLPNQAIGQQCVQLHEILTTSTQSRRIGDAQSGPAMSGFERCEEFPGAVKQTCGRRSGKEQRATPADGIAPPEPRGLRQ